MIDNDMHVLRSSTQPRAHQGNDVENNDASIYDMDNYEAASIFEEQHGNTINEDSRSLSGNVLDIDDYRVSPWYDWAYVHFLERGEENYYPSLILGFIEVGGNVEALVQCSTRPLKWSTVESNMFVAITLGNKSESFVRVPLSSLVFTLCVIQDYGGQRNKYFVVLPRSGWGKFFGRDINND